MPTPKRSVPSTASRPGLRALRFTQPDETKTKAYVYGVEKLNGYDAWALFEASARGDVAKVKTLLAKDPRLVNAQVAYRFPIHMAVFAGDAEMVELLLDEGADPGQSIYTYDSWDKLLLNARERGLGRVETLLERAMRNRFNYSRDFAALRDAIVARDAGKVDSILRQRPKLVRASDALGNNALHWSVLTRQLNLIERFARRGTPLDAQRADGQTPVLLAANGATDYWYRATRGRSHPSLRNTSVIVGCLLALGANYTISVAAAVGDQERVEQLLQDDPGAARRLDSARVSPLSHAAAQGHLHIVRLLLEHGADPNLPENAAPCGLALYEACRANHLEVAELLLTHGADPNAGVDSSECCLTIGEVYHGKRAKALEQLLRRHGAYKPSYHLNIAEMKQAIRDGHEVARELLGNVLATGNAALLDLYLDSRPGVTDRMDNWPGVHYPRSPVLVRNLLARGLDPNRRDWLGRTFLHLCADNGDRSATVAFLAAGADIDARDFEFRGTPLAAAVRHEPWRSEDRTKHAQRQRRMVEFLLKRGAATNLPGDEPWATPLAWARKRGQEDIEAVLVKHGAT